MESNAIRLNRKEKVLLIAKELFPDKIEFFNEIIYNIESYSAKSEEIFGKTLYHTDQHIFAVVIRSFAIGKQLSLTVEELKILFCAALLHDMYHSFGASSDVLNVTVAIYVANNCFTNNFGKEFTSSVSDAILCTVYPYRIRPQNEVEKILRDCDITMCLEPDAESFAVGLTNELSISGKNIIMSVDDMYEFSKSQRFYTIPVANLFGIPYAYAKA